MQLVPSWVMKRLGKAMKLVKTRLPFHFFTKDITIYTIPQKFSTSCNTTEHDRRGYEQFRNTLRMNTNSDSGTTEH